MRWNKPNPYDVKIKKQFAFLPIEVNNEVRWLEFVKIKYVYGRAKWHATKFVDSKEEETAIMTTDTQRSKRYQYPCIGCKNGYGYKMSEGKMVNCYDGCIRYQIYKAERESENNETCL